MCADEIADIKPLHNPFNGVAKGKTGEETPAATFEHLLKFVKAADELDLPSVGTAAMIAFYWLQRKVDIIHKFRWTHYEPNERVRILHNKTKHENYIPLVEEDGAPIYAELEERLANLKKRGPLIVMRDHIDRRKKIYLPYTKDLFENHVNKVLRHADLFGKIEFSSFRHGGMTEAANAAATDQQLMALSGHKTRPILSTYVKRTNLQALQAGILRRDSRMARTKREESS